MVELGSKLSDGVFCITCGSISKFDKIIKMYDAFKCKQCQKPFKIETRTTLGKDSQEVINSTRFKIINLIDDYVYQVERIIIQRIKKTTKEGISIEEHSITRNSSRSRNSS